MNKRLAALILIILLGAWLRFDALRQDVRFHPDEALFATFARNAAVHGQWLLPGALDKPPLSLYASALSMHLFGVVVNDKDVLDLDLRIGEVSARLPDAFAGIFTIALVYALGHTLCESSVGLCAALLTALSPRLVSYSATAFTDPLMLMFMTAALVAEARKRAAWSGMLLALAFAAKQQALFYAPLLVVFLIYGHGGDALYLAASTNVFKNLARFGLALFFGVVLLLLWDAARPEDSIFALAAVNNDPERVLVRGDELLPRLGIWLSYAATIFGAWWLTFGVIIAGFVVGWSGNWAKRTRSIVFLQVYVVGYFGLHWVFAFNTYDRYLLPIVPLLAVIGGHGIIFVYHQIANSAEKNFSVFSLRALRLGGLIWLVIVMLFSQISFPDDNRARDTQIIDLATFINAQSLGTIIYDHWLGWQMGYYIGAWSDKRRVYYPDAETQAADAVLNPERAPRFIIAPDTVEITPWLDALEQVGFEVERSPAYHSPDYAAYKVTLAEQ